MARRKKSVQEENPLQSEENTKPTESKGQAGEDSKPTVTDESGFNGSGIAESLNEHPKFHKFRGEK